MDNAERTNNATCSINFRKPSGVQRLVVEVVRHRISRSHAEVLYRQWNRVRAQAPCCLAANVFTLLTAYYILKTVREALILVEGGAEVKAYASAGQAVLLLAIVPAYGWLASRLTRFRLVTAVMLFFLSNLPVFYLLNASGFPIGVPFFLWLGIFNLMALAQFWAFANDLYTEEQGKRLFPVLGIGSSLGALAGSKIAAVFFADLGVDRLLLVAGGLMAGSLLLTWCVNRRACTVCPIQRSNNASPLGSRGAFEIVSFRSIPPPRCLDGCSTEPCQHRRGVLIEQTGDGGSCARSHRRRRSFGCQANLYWKLLWDLLCLGRDWRPNSPVVSRFPVVSLDRSSRNYVFLAGNCARRL